MLENKYLKKKIKRDKKINEREKTEKENIKNKNGTKKQTLKDNIILGDIKIVKNDLNQRIINSSKEERRRNKRL